MTALALKQIVAQELATIGVDPTEAVSGKDRPRRTAWYGSTHGLGLRHYASGRKIHVVQTRMGGRLRTITIGPASLITEAQARTIARRVVGAALVGGDPATERERVRAAPRFDDFLDEYWRRCSPKWKPETLRTHDVYRGVYLDQAFPGVFIDQLDESHVTRWFARVTAAAGPGGANRTMCILNNMLNKAEAWGYRPENTNPCRAVRRNPRRKCERFLSEEEMRRLGQVLAEERAAGGVFRPLIADAVTLILLTGCRVSEILGLQWQDVRDHRIKLRDSKTGPRTVWLGDDARAVIDRLPRQRNNPWLFANPQTGKALARIREHWYDIRARAGLDRMRLHDLRHTFASHAVRNKETLTMVGQLLGHRYPQSTARYAHWADEDVLRAAQQVGDVIERLIVK